MMLHTIQQLSKRVQTILNSILHIHQPMLLVVQATRAQCLQLLQANSQPKQKALHLSDVFTDGRRYYFEATKSGFSLQTNTAKRLYRQRTGHFVTLHGTLTEVDSTIPTLIRLNFRFGYLATLRTMLYPAFVAVVIYFAPLPFNMRSIIAFLILILAWLSCRLDAAIQAGDMAYFVRRALETFPQPEIPQLPNRSADVIVNKDFRSSWQKFYQEQVNQQSDAP